MDLLWLFGRALDKTSKASQCKGTQNILYDLNCMESTLKTENMMEFIETPVSAKPKYNLCCKMLNY